MLSGETAVVNDVVAQLTARGVFCRPVKVDVASHSPQVDELRADLSQALAPVRPLEGEIPFHSTVEAAPLPGAALDPQYWVRNLREPVRFHDAVQQLIADGFDAFVEISPHPVLLPSIEDALADGGADAVAVATARRDADERGEMLGALARLYERGLDPAWPQVGPRAGAVAALPAYPWQRERFWVESPAQAAALAWLARRAAADAGDDVRGWLHAPAWSALDGARRGPGSRAWRMAAAR